MRVDRYENGVMVEGYGLFGTAEQNVEAAEGMNGLLRGIRFLVYTVPLSRSGDDDPCEGIGTGMGGGSGSTATFCSQCGARLTGSQSSNLCMQCRAIEIDPVVVTNCLTCYRRISDCNCDNVTYCNVCWNFISRCSCGGAPSDGGGSQYPDPGDGGGDVGDQGGGYTPPTNPGQEEKGIIDPRCDEDWRERAEGMLESIRESVLGMKLIQKLIALLEASNNNVYLLFTNIRPSGSEQRDLGRTYYDSNGDIKCFIFYDHLPTLFEELGHAFQAKNHPHDISIHREMEVKMMVYDFYQELGVVPLGNERDWEIINNFSNGDASANKAKRALGRMGYDTSGFDPNTFHTNNLNELRN